MKYYICEHKTGSGRCRKHVSVVVIYRSYYGEEAGPNGPVKRFVVRAVYRCDDHAHPPGSCELVEVRPFVKRN